MSSLTITRDDYSACTVLRVNGRVDSSNAVIFDQALKELTNNGRYRIVLCLKDVDNIVSAGLRAIISAQRECQPSGNVHLAELSWRVQDVMSLAGLYSVLAIYDNYQEAMSAFSS